MKQSAAAAIFSDLTDNVSFYDFLWSRALLQRLLALQPLDEHSSLGKEAVAKSPPTKSPSLLQVINAASNRALHHNFESKCWLKNFFHTPESAIVFCQQVGTHPLQLTTQVVLAAVLTFFRIVSSLLQLRRINSTIEIWIMRCKYDLSTPFFQHKENIVQTADTLIVESEHVQLAINSE